MYEFAKFKGLINIRKDQNYVELKISASKSFNYINIQNYTNY